MNLNKNKGRWFTKKDEEYNIVDTPSELDDIAYHFYCRDKKSKSCVPQITFMWNVKKFKHKLFVGYYNKAEKVLKIEKLINMCHES